ncbi:MAG: hypothetical protein K2K68_06085 [Duncaniella sp.]|nr:hypothetical protein [Duncaniella sp.]MDE6582282.1 hypothetical protein [Duncaniella sp.]
MKKFRFFFVIMAFFTMASVALTSCETDNDEPYYAGESAEDYKPNTYNISSEWDFSNVAGLSANEKKVLEQQFAATVNTSKVFNSRSEAVAAFDQLVENLANNSEMKQLKGLSCKAILKRGSAIIKSSKISW